jgi:hypothetical protein
MVQGLPLDHDRDHDRRGDAAPPVEITAAGHG